jgi:hypothetical protein
MMQSYQILMEDKNGIWRALELGADRIAWTCQANDIADVSDRNASYSQALKLPKTAGNAALFDYANHFDAVTDVPYRKHPCRVFCAGRVIAGKGSFLILSKVSEYFECQILSGNASFFEALKDAPMGALDLGVFRVCNRSLDPASWHPAYRIAYGSDVVIPSWPYGNASVEISYLGEAGARYPVVSAGYVLQQIVSLHGYTFESNVDAWEKMYLSIASAEAEPSAEDLDTLDMEIHTHGWQPVPGSLPAVQFQWDVDADADGCVLENPPADDKITLRIPPGEKINFTITSYAAGSAPTARTAHYLFKRMNDETMEEGDIVLDGVSRDVSFEWENTFNTVVRVEITVTCDDEPAPGMGLSIKGEVLRGGTANAGAQLVLSERLGFETQFDFMKFFAQAFGLTFFVDETAKRIHAYTMQLLYDNVASGNVRDWSGKVERDPGSACSFTMGSYARENIVSLEENSKDEYTDSAKFFIDNRTLEASKEALKIGIGSGKDLPVYHFFFDVGFPGYTEVAASIPLVELRRPSEMEEGGDPYKYETVAFLADASFPSIKPHLVELTERTVPVRPFIFEKTEYEYRIANHVTAGRIVDMGYSILGDKLLKRAKLVEDKFHLTPEDVELFDPSVPVYIEKYGAYFYVNKIRNFELGNLTTCELIKL